MPDIPQQTDHPVWSWGSRRARNQQRREEIERHEDIIREAAEKHGLGDHKANTTMLQQFIADALEIPVDVLGEAWSPDLENLIVLLMVKERVDAASAVPEVE
tara:strand:- start:583 stop:888 length:306 start_codon:yes stop_codon:yes gene_type:complete